MGEDTNNLCRSGWCPLDDVNENATTVQCSANGEGNYAFPVLNASYLDDHCPYNQKACVYDIETDPCEYYDVSQNNSAVYDELYQRLLFYNSSMVTPLATLHPANDTAADPAQFGGFWSPWVNNSN